MTREASKLACSQFILKYELISIVSFQYRARCDITQSYIKHVKMAENGANPFYVTFIMTSSSLALGVKLMQYSWYNSCAMIILTLISIGGSKLLLKASALNALNSS